MIIVKLTGGLGNQMFQYAAARRLAHYHNTELKLDISFLRDSRGSCTPRFFQLNHLAVTASVATPHEIASIREQKKSVFRLVTSSFSSLMGIPRHNDMVFNERTFNFDPEVLSLPDNTYLAGYWQSEKYFQDIEKIIRREFTLNSPLEGRNKEILDLIEATNSVSVHVRRGDFVTDINVNKVHGVCPVDYYHRSIERMVANVGNVHLFVFSDEPSWVAEQIDFSVPVTVVYQNAADAAYQDMCLMGHCRHHIIANSSFSWWGAWLAGGGGKQVIAPDKWFCDLASDTSDLIPEGWQRL